MKARIAAVTLALFAFPATALAIDDARAPDQRTDEEIPSRLATIGTDVAAPDQQASHYHSVQGHLPSSPADAPLNADSASSGSGFDWSDAGAGAAGAACLIALSVGGVTVLRRRDRRPPSAVAG